MKHGDSHQLLKPSENDDLTKNNDGFRSGLGPEHRWLHYREINVMKTVCKHGGIFHPSRKLRDPNSIAKDWVEPVVTLWLFNIAMV